MVISTFHDIATSGLGFSDFLFLSSLLCNRDLFYYVSFAKLEGKDSELEVFANM